MSKTLKPSELKACDVLLYRGHGLVSDLIRLFDGSEYSHAAIYDGARIAEAIAEGVVCREVAASVKGAKYVDVYRWIGPTGAHLGDPNYEAAPIQARIRFYVGEKERYAFEELILLALLTSTRRLPSSDGFPAWAPSCGPSWTTPRPP